MKPTKEERSLCKQIAEKYRKEIKVGSYVIWAGRLCLVLESGKNYDYIAVKWLKGREQKTVSYKWIEQKYALPLWTISDCLEFLKSKNFIGGLLDRGNNYVANYTKVIVGENNEDLSVKVHSRICKTPLEACLKAVLAVLEEEE